jgi:hypothetical protein
MCTALCGLVSGSMCTALKWLGQWFPCAPPSSGLVSGFHVHRPLWPGQWRLTQLVFINTTNLNESPAYIIQHCVVRRRHSDYLTCATCQTASL